MQDYNCILTKERKQILFDHLFKFPGVGSAPADPSSFLGEGKLSDPHAMQVFGGAAASPAARRKSFWVGLRPPRPALGAVFLGGGGGFTGRSSQTWPPRPEPARDSLKLIGILSLRRWNT